MAKPRPWSFSALNGFTTCPHRHLEVKVLKHFKDESGEAAQWGSYVHKCIEDAINDGAPMPDNVKTYGPQVWATIDGLAGARAEVKLAINTQLEPVPWDERWCGSISDVLKIYEDTAWVIDWKLGKTPKFTNQLKLNALMVFYNYPDVNTVHTRFAWLAHGSSMKESYTRDQIPELWNVFMSELKQYVQAFKTDVWQKRPSGLCKNYCPVTSCENCGQFSGRNIRSI